jgi:hypothetical protein
MPKKKSSDTDEPEQILETDPISSDAIDIYDEADQFVRQYSREVHGDNFAELAESYLTGHPKCHKKIN